MRILKVRFKNLNSLAGEWEIDLARPEYADGLFAITGPTGAGKSTILDAVSLALYGRTPRLQRISESENEVMSRHTGECFAETTFETGKGRYRCRWEQHRARGKPDGKLRPASRELANADTNEPLETKSKAIEKKIVDLTGMDFERFSRSMLLAQGDFAGFLQASPTDRAPILEQITGTEIYGNISKRTHERYAEEQRKLAELEKLLEGMQPLADGDERRICDEIASHEKNAADLDLLLTRKREAVQWYRDIARLEGERGDIERREGELGIEQERFRPDAERLKRAMVALELDGRYAALAMVRSELEKERSALAQGRDALPGLDAKAASLDGELDLLRKRLGRAEEECAERGPVLKRVRELDVVLAERGRGIKEAADALTKLSRSLKALQREQAENSSELQRKNDALAAANGWLRDNASDASLVERLAGIREKTEALSALRKQLADRNGEIERDAKAGEKADANYSALRGKLERLRNDRKKMEEERAESLRTLETLLGDATLAEWHSRLASLRERKVALAAARKARDESIALQERSRGQAERLGRLDREIAVLAESGGKAGERRARLEENLELLEVKLRLIREVESLRDKRAKLREGEACPLCGALEHPYASGDLPEAAGEQTALDNAKREAATAREDESRAAVSLAEKRKEREHLAEEIAETASLIADKERVLSDMYGALVSGGADAPDDSELSRLIAAVDEEIGSVTETIERGTQLEAGAGSLAASIDAERKRAEALEAAVQQAAVDKSALASGLEQLRRDAASMEARLRHSLQEVAAEGASYGVPEVRQEAVSDFLDGLTARRDAWQEKRNAQLALESETASLGAAIRAGATQIEESARNVETQTGALEKMKNERDALRRERSGLLGDDNPDDVERRLAENVAAARDEGNRKEEERNEARRNAAQLRLRIGELEESVTGRTATENDLSSAFFLILSDKGFADEAAYRAAVLPENERRELDDAGRELEERARRLAALKQRNGEALAAERQKRLSDESEEKLVAEVAEGDGKLRELHQAIGALRRRLDDNAQLKTKHEKQLSAIKAQKRECERWGRLHKLIGSADGKKFRNFAQGLTLDAMLRHANEQLRKMSDRYLLLRDSEQSLDINVMDNYQGGTVRSTRNLSGGETFIVSLALALGLSGMVSENVRVDSLFLDEGFGTLDEDALETALDTLAGLRQDDKLIGVISHVQAVRERIPARIQVVPRSDGTSRLAGPGCRAVGGENT